MRGVGISAGTWGHRSCYYFGYEFFERQGSIERIFFEFLRTRSYYESLNEVTIILKRERKRYFEIS